MRCPYTKGYYALPQTWMGWDGVWEWEWVIHAQREKRSEAKCH
jgi:hypothetical protein